MSNATSNDQTPAEDGHAEEGRTSGGDHAIRISTAAVVIGVALVAAFVSYLHAHELVVAYGEDGATAIAMPLTVDGLIFAASMVMLDAARRGHGRPILAECTLALGITASILANVAHGLTHGIVGAIIAGWPALALALVYHLLMILIRGEHDGRNEPTESGVSEADYAVPEVDQLKVQAREVFAEDLAAGRRPSIRAIRSELKVGQPRAQQIQAYLAD